MPNSPFLCFLFICHPHSFPTHTNTLACHINYQCLSSFHFLFMREITFVFFSVKMTGKTKRRRQIRSKKDKKKKSLSACIITDKLIIKKQKATMSCQMSKNIDHLSLVFLALMSRRLTMFVLQVRKVK